MGATVSACDKETSCATGLLDLPENCTTFILTKLDPPEICRLAKVNRSLCEASSVDLVWESKLPSNYQFLIKRVLGQDKIMNNLSKREIYAKLCRSNRFDADTKEFWMDKSNGSVCLAISSKGLKITGIEDRRYWSFVPTEESRFQNIAYLQQMWWVEVEGEIEFEFPNGSYSVFLRLQLGRPSRRFGIRICDVDQVHGWDMKPLKLQLSTSNGYHASSKCFLHKAGRWTNYHVGDFVVENTNTNTPTKIKMSMLQNDCTHTKGGLCVDSVLIYPSDR